ncbi:Immunity protein Imm1 [Actinopolyspora lacussalsi subsp. righensis]|uniref:Immunity protein Imm1 n=1 Tax=Actinopolyspora righensis TaxID=995060 RepID=A0A1I6ZBL1_9ACTN|nr:Imm1 family immunity protein [Actinopolyspora righensis]SFT60126.1 Immunity protein Imm1 [Actinopolyspora righensis]
MTNALTEAQQRVNAFGVVLSAEHDPDELIRGITEWESTIEGDDPEFGLVWFFMHSAEEGARTLTVGLRRTTGALAWFEDDAFLVPTDGTNDEHVDYFSTEGHHFPMDSRTEIPREKALAALREFVQHDALPNGIEWVEQ